MFFEIEEEMTFVTTNTKTYWKVIDGNKQSGSSENQDGSYCSLMVETGSTTNKDRAPKLLDANKMLKPLAIEYK